MTAVAGGRLPAQLTSFVGRQSQLTQLRQLMCEYRLLTLAGSGGVGKTRLAAQLAGELTDEFDAGVWWVDLAPITDPDLVAVATARTLDLADQPGHSAVDNLVRFIADRPTLLVLDNCEHLLDACATLLIALLGACPRLQVVATSREPIGVAGELIWRTPSLSLADEAVELFAQRALLGRPDFAVTTANAAAVTEICRRLDGVALAIELAAAQMRSLSPVEILDGLQDRFALLTGRARTAVPRHQTLRASVDWSYASLTEPERVMFRRLGVFLGGFDLDAARAVTGPTELPRQQILTELMLLVDKSLVLVDDRGRGTRYRMLETVRHYALEKLAESGEADTVRTHHRDHYTALFGVSTPVGLQQRIEQADVEIDNLRAAFTWSRENHDIELAAQLTSSLQLLWLRGRILEGLTWLDAVLSESAAMPAVQARALADKTVLDHVAGVFNRLDQAEQGLAIARALDDPDLLVRTLTACGIACLFHAEVALPYFAEAIGLARTLEDNWLLSWILAWQANAAFMAGDPTATRLAAEEGRDCADVIGDEVLSRTCRWFLGLAHWLSADVAESVEQFRDVVARASAVNDAMWLVNGLSRLSKALARQGDTDGARRAANAAHQAAAGMAGHQQALALGALVDVALAAGDAAAAVAASDAAWQICPQISLVAVNTNPVAQAKLVSGDLGAARHWADEAISAASGAHRIVVLATRVRVAMAQGDAGQANRDAHEALSIATASKAYLAIPDILECLAGSAVDSGGHRDAARIFGAAQAMRDRTGQVRFKVYDEGHQASVVRLRAVMDPQEFTAGWAEGGEMSTDEAIAYAHRGRGKRGRPAKGWASLTPTEREVARLVSDGLSNSAVAARLFVSPRTVQAHLAHIYAKLGVTSRVQLAQEASRT